MAYSGVQPVCASWREAVGWTKLNFLGLFPKSGKDNKIAKSVIITYHFPYNSKTLIKPVLEYLYLFERVWREKFWMLLGDTIKSVR